MADAIQPVAASDAPTVPLTAVAVFDEPPKKKRHPVRTLLIVLVVLAVLVAAFFVADAIARSYATNYVRDRIIETLKIDKSTEVDVNLGSGSVLLQAAAGAINEVNVDVPAVTFGDISGAAHLTATHVPLDSAKPVEGLTVAVTVSQENVQKLSKYLSGVDLKSIDLTDGVIRVSAEFAVLFRNDPGHDRPRAVGKLGRHHLRPEDDRRVGQPDLRRRPPQQPVGVIRRGRPA